MNKKHNGLVGFYKFIFSLVIVFFHSTDFYKNIENPFFKHGYIGVEFFFLVSGYYFAKSTLKGSYSKEKIGINDVQMIWKKLKSLIPYIICAYLVSICWAVYERHFGTADLINSIWNLLLIKQFGLRGAPLLAQLWFLSSMLISMFALYPFVKKYKENFIMIGSSIIVLVGLGYLNHIQEGLNISHETWLFFSRAGTARAFVEINLGMIIYVVNKHLKEIKYTNFFATMMTILQHLLIIIVLLIVTFIDNSPKYDYILLLFITIAIQIMVSEKTKDFKLFQKKSIYYLEKLSLPIFINHKVFTDIIQNINYFATINPIIQTFIAIGLTIAVSVIEMEIIKIFENKNLSSRVKKLIVAE